MTTLFDVELPAGWTAAPIELSPVRGIYVYYVITAPGLGYVTLAIRERGFRAGHSTTGPLQSGKYYEGRGWRTKLCTDAITWLRGQQNSSPKKVRRR